MKRKFFHNFLSTTASVIACAFLIYNTIPVPIPTETKLPDIEIEIPELENENKLPGYSPLNDEDSPDELLGQS